MPGIVGIITRAPRDRTVATLARMVDAIRHTPAYVTGTWADEEMGVYVGWAARPASFASRMPVWNERRDVMLVFSGEEYSAPPANGGPVARGGGEEYNPASYLARLAENEDDFPRSLNGRFHGLLLDRRTSVAQLFNDRYGMHRLYWHQSRDALFFAAEAKAILSVCPALRTVDSRSLGEYVSCGCVLENRTLFRGIGVMPPGSAWLVHRGAVERKRTYFRAREWEEQGTLEPESYYRELRDTFSRTLPRYFGGDEPIGMSLTGGLDSRIIMAWRQPRPGTLPCYSFGGMFRDCQDVRIARRVAGICRQPHTVIPVGQEFLRRFPDYAARTVYLTDGCVDVSHAPDLYVNERAADIAPVRMTGNYGGEVLRHVRAFKPMPIGPGAFNAGVQDAIQTARETYAAAVEGHPLSFAVFRQAPWHHYGLLALEQTQLALRSPYLDNAIVRLVFRAPAAVLADNAVSLRLIADGNAALAGIPTDRGISRDTGWARRLAHGFQEFTFKAEYAYDYGMPQAVAALDHLLAPLRPEGLFLGRHKFYHFRSWYRSALSGYVREMLLDRATLTRPYLERRGLEPMVRRHLKGDRNHTLTIHKVLTLELLHRQLIDAAADASCAIA